MSGLSAFMAENVQVAENIKLIVSKRFIDNGKPVEWEIKPITSEDDEILKKSCTRQVKLPGKKNIYVPETDFSKYMCKLAVSCIVYPNLDDEALQDSYKVMGAEALLKKMLLPGEYTDLLKSVQEINAFDVDLEDLVEDVKN